MGCVFIGMAEVSSCMVDVTPGSKNRQYVEPGVVDAFVVRPPFSHDTPPVRVNGALARAR